MTSFYLHQLTDLTKEGGHIAYIQRDGRIDDAQVVEKDALIQEKEKLYVQLKNIIARLTTLHNV